MPTHIQNHIQALINNFIWNDRKIRVSSEITQQPIEKVGLALINVKQKIKSLHLMLNF